MRNLKKVLALVLALVMCLSLVTIANASDFSDDADIEYDEAVDVMVAAGIIDGVGNNSFDPKGTLTREQAAKLITYMLLGENSDKLGIENSSFKDVAVTRWSAPAIEYCATMGIIDGAGDGNFYPAGKLTGYAFAKMLLTAIGYKSDREGFTGTSWTINVATKALSEDVRLDRGLATMFGNAELTRQEAAQMALNAIKAPLVEYDNDNTISVNGATVQINGGTAKFVTTTLAKEQRISERKLTNTNANTQNSGYTVEFGERYLPKLECKHDVDVFGRPSYTWSYDRKEIGSYIDKDLLVAEYTKKVTGRELYDLLGRSVVEENSDRDKNYDFLISVDGETTKNVLDNSALSLAVKDKYFFDRTSLNRDNTNQVGGTGNGVLTQVFQDTDNRIVYIAVINTYLAVAEDDYNEKKDETSFEVWNLTKVNSNKDLVKYNDKTGNLKASGEDFDVKDIKADDIVLVRVADNAIQEIITPETVDNTTIASFKNGSYVTADGKQYDYASTAKYDDETLNKYTDDNMKDTTYRIFLDPYGYLIGIEKVESDDHYLFLTGIDASTSNLKDKKAEGNALFLDGTSASITIDLKESKNSAGKTFSVGDNGANGTMISSLMNTWCTYSVDDNNVYTLKEVANTDTQFSVKGNKIGQSHMGGTYKVGSDTYYYTTGTITSIAGGGTPASQVAGKAAGQLTYGVSGDGTNEEYVTINKKNVSLDGFKGSTSFKKVYGNNDTIYLSAATDMIIADKTINVTGSTAKKPAVIITDVEAVSIGVQKVDLKAFNAQAVLNAGVDNGDYTAASVAGMCYENVSDGVYTLFNNKGYVIAAVIVGENSGANTQYAWVSSSNMNREGYGSNKWEYSRDVIIDGKLVTLTEIESAGAKDPAISNKDSGFSAADEQSSIWWDVKTYADGTVKSVKHITSNGTNYEYVTDIDKVYDTSKDTVILEQGFNVPGGEAGTFKVRVTANTLNMESRTGKVRGLAVSPEANIVVVKDEQIYRGDTPINEWNYKEDIEYFTNDDDASGLKRAVNYLNDDDAFQGYVAAICEGGRAVTLIIYDKTESEVDTGIGVGVGKYSTEVDDDITTGLDNLDLTDPANNKVSGGDLELNVYGGGSIAVQIREALISLGYEVTGNIVRDNANSQYKVQTVKDGVEEEILAKDAKLHKYWVLDNGGTQSFVPDGYSATTTDPANGDGSTGVQVRSATDRNDKTYAAYGTYTINGDVSIVYGYVDVVVATDTTASAGGVTIASFALKDTTLATAGVKPGDTIEYVVTYSGTANADVTITFAAGTNSTADGSTTVSIANGTAVPTDTTAIFKAKVAKPATGDIAAASVAIATVP